MALPAEAVVYGHTLAGSTRETCRQNWVCRRG